MNNFTVMEENYRDVDIHNQTAVASYSAGNLQLIELVAYDMETVYLWIILALGFPGNCVAVVTVIKMSPSRSISVYIALLAIVDNLAILSKLLLFVLLDKGVNIGQFGCKTLGYFGNFLGTFANWLLVAMSVERFAAVWFPIKLARMWSSKKSLAAVIVIASMLAVLFLHLFWTVGFVDDQKAHMMYCSIHEQYKHFAMHAWYWINVVVFALFPCALLVVFNMLIVLGIRKASKAQRTLECNQSKHLRHDSRRNPQVTAMLLMAAVALVILITPRCIMLILTKYWHPAEQTIEGSVEYLLDTIAFVLCDFTHAINFYVYFLSAKKFRRQFRELCFCRKSRSVQGNIQYSSLFGRTSILSHTSK